MLLMRFCTGQGDVKIGLTYDKHLSNSRAKSKGKEIREAYIAAIPGLSDLLDAIGSASNRGFVKGIDGRKIPHVTACCTQLPTTGICCSDSKALDEPMTTTIAAHNLPLFMTNSNMSAHPNIPTYLSPIWKLRLQKPITTSESQSLQKASLEPQRHTLIMSTYRTTEFLVDGDVNHTYEDLNYQEKLKIKALEGLDSLAASLNAISNIKAIEFQINHLNDVTTGFTDQLTV